jgi:phosphate uptake regulator
MLDWLQHLRDPEGGQHMLRRFQNMLSDGRHAFDSAIAVILSGGDPAAVREEVFETDQRINRNEQALRRELIVYASVRGASAFPTSLLLMSLVKDAERIGDYAKNILDLARHEHSLNEEEQELVTRLAAKASEMLRQAANLFASQNEASAAAFLEEELDLRHQCESTIDKWIDDADRNHSAACLVTRFIKRVVGHAGNVVSSVVMPLDKLDFHPGGGGDED